MSEGADGIFQGFPLLAGDIEFCAASSILEAYGSFHNNETVLRLIEHCGSAGIVVE